VAQGKLSIMQVVRQSLQTEGVITSKLSLFILNSILDFIKDFSLQWWDLCLTTLCKYIFGKINDKKLEYSWRM